MYNRYPKHKEIIIVPKNNEKNTLKSLNKIDIKPKTNTYENIREIVLEKKKDINLEIPNKKKLKNNIV